MRALRAWLRREAVAWRHVSRMIDELERGRPQIWP